VVVVVVVVIMAVVYHVLEFLQLKHQHYKISDPRSTFHLRLYPVQTPVIRK